MKRKNRYFNPFGMYSDNIEFPHKTKLEIMVKRWKEYASKYFLIVCEVLPELSYRFLAPSSFLISFSFFMPTEHPIDILFSKPTP